MSGQAFKVWWEAYRENGDLPLGSPFYEPCADAWLEAWRQAAKAAWEAETHHDAVGAINSLAGETVFEP